MKENLLRRRLKENRLAVGHMLMEFDSRGVAKIVEAAGVDFAVLDMEHSGMDLARIADLIAWFKATAVATVVRVPAPEYHFIARCLDAGAQGIMVPNVESAEEACRVVSAAKYAPPGRRGVGLGTSHNDFVPPVPREYLEEANLQTVVICQIESVRGLEELESIAVTPGVDVLWVGHYDLTHSMGIIGEFEHPRFLEALARVPETARRYGKHAAIQPASLEQAAAWTRLGYRIISCSTNIAVYRTALAASVAAVRSACGTVQIPSEGPSYGQR